MPRPLSSGSPLALLWLSFGQLMCFPWPSGLSAPWKGPQSSSPPEGSPGGATLDTTQLYLSGQTRATYSSTLVTPWCFLYHVCQWAISLRAFWLQPLHGKKRSLFVSLVLDRQLRATLTTFTHNDSEPPRRVKYKPKWLFHTCQL